MDAAPLVLIPENPAPPGAEAHWPTLPEGIRLRAVLWAPEKAGIARPRGSVFIFNGRTEYAEKYFEVAGELIARGFAVATLDWRGQGLSERLLEDPRKGHIDDFASYGRDLDFFMQQMAPALPRPHLALAHSMGGHNLLRWLHENPARLDGAVLSSPMLGLLLGGPLIRRILRRAVSLLVKCGREHRYVPGGTSEAVDGTPFEQNILTSDPERYARMVLLTKKEPLLGLGAPTLGWLDAAFRSMEMAGMRDFLQDIQTPLLVLGAGADTLVDSEATRSAASLLPQAAYVNVAGARHEILMERDPFRAQFWRAFDGFAARFSG